MNYKSWAWVLLMHAVATCTWALPGEDGDVDGSSGRTCPHEGSAYLALHLVDPSVTSNTRDDPSGDPARPPPLGLLVPLAVEPDRHPTVDDVVSELHAQFSDMCTSQVAAAQNLHANCLRILLWGSRNLPRSLPCTLGCSCVVVSQAGSFPRPDAWGQAACVRSLEAQLRAWIAAKCAADGGPRSAGPRSGDGGDDVDGLDEEEERRAWAHEAPESRAGFPAHSSHGASRGGGAQEPPSCGVVVATAYVRVPAYARRGRGEYLANALAQLPPLLFAPRRCAVLFSDDGDFLDQVRSRESRSE